MSDILAACTERPELKVMAADIIEVQTAEIGQMKAWLSAWFPVERQ